MKKKILQGIIIINILLLLIVGCSRNINIDEDVNSDELLNNEQQKESSIIKDEKESGSEKQIIADKGDIFNLYIKDNELYMVYGDSSIFLNNVDISQIEIQYKVLHSDENEMYVVVYYSYRYCGGAGKYIPFHVVKIDKKQEDLQYIFDEDNILIQHKFINDKLYLTINSTEEVIIDTSDIIENLGYKKNDLISKNTISVGNTSTLEVNDYVGNNTQQLFIRCQVKDIIGSTELGYIYMVLQIKEGEVQILKVFEENLNNTIVNSIGKESHWRIIDEDENRDIINRLIENNVVRIEGEYLVFSFE